MVVIHEVVMSPFRHVIALDFRVAPPIHGGQLRREGGGWGGGLTNSGNTPSRHFHLHFHCHFFFSPPFLLFLPPDLSHTNNYILTT